VTPTLQKQQRPCDAAERVRRAVPLAALLFSLTSNCAGYGGDATELSEVALTGAAGSSGEAQAPDSSTTELAEPAAPDERAAASADRESSAPQPAEPSVGACPRGTREVQGLYCTDLLHQCIKGGKNHRFEPVNDEAEPFYCDKFQVGYARCLGREEPKHFCIDEYEYPNQQGAIPRVMVSWYEAKQLCEERGERLCDDDEWTLACEGPERLPYPYGWQRDGSACNIDQTWIQPNDGLLGSRTAASDAVEHEVERLSQRVPSGSMPGCRSPYGVMDMAGNVDEWAVNATLHGKPHRSTFKGGHWVYGARNRCRPVTATHGEATTYYAEGFRCCADPRR
jgi:formylglycine-generating enzyme